MFTPLKPPRGSAAQVAMHTGAEGSIVVNTDAKTIHVHDGVTPGGFALSKVGHQHTKNEIISFLGYLPVDPSTIGQANGVAPLDATGKVPASMIPNGAGGGGVSDAGDLTGNTLSPSVVSSSLTSVGVLQNLTVAGVISGSVSGSASKLSNARSIVISGDVDGSASFDGSADINISVALDDVNSSPVENALKKITVNAKGQVISTDDVSLQDLSDALGFTPVSQSYVDGVASNFVQRPGVRFASDANLAGTYSNGTTGEDATLTGSGSIPAIGGGTPVLNDRIALMYQGNGVQNGIYKVTQTNPWVLTRDGGLDDVKNGAMVLVAEGTHAGEKWIQIAPNPITLGTSPLQYTMFQAAATAYQSGAGINIQNNTITNTGVRSLAGTPNQISFSGSTGAITASLAPSVTISGTMTAGSFAGSGASLTGLNAANLSTGIVPTARLGSGTADGTTFLAGDGTWKNISVDASNLAGFGEVAYNANKRGVYAGVRTIVNQGANPVVVLNQTGASSGNRTSIISALADGSIRWTLNSDDMSSLGAFMSVYRNVGTATSIVFTSTAFQIQANTSIAGTLNVSSVITGNGSGLTALNASSLSSGTVPAARLGSGTANASTFLAGDGTWRSAVASTINATGQVTLDSSRAGFTAGLNPSSNPLVYMVNAAALTNSKVMYQSYTSAGVFNMGWMTDAGSQATPFLAATRNGGDVTTANLVLTADIVNVQGTLNATSFTGNGSGLTNLNASNLATGIVPVARLASGTPDNTTFLRGDGTWATVTSTWNGGTVSAATSFTSTLAVKSVSGDVVAVAASNIDCSAGNYFTKTASGALTWTVSNVPASRFYSFILKLTNGGTGAQTWFSNTKWEGGTAPTLSASGVDILGFFTDDGGATWHGIALSIGSR